MWMVSWSLCTFRFIGHSFKNILGNYKKSTSYIIFYQCNHKQMVLYFFLVLICCLLWYHYVSVLSLVVKIITPSVPFYLSYFSFSSVPKYCPLSKSEHHYIYFFPILPFQLLWQWYIILIVVIHSRLGIVQIWRIF